ncbi:MAG: ROK family protein [Treponema sp.]|jgi:glucokinase|nr:ROK family protein [Treponema sp.]
MYLIGVDIGGTKCRVSLAQEKNGELIFISRENARNTEGQGYDKILELLLTDIRILLPQIKKLDAIGISCGGPLDLKRGLILSPPNLPGWDRVPVTDFFSEAVGVPVFLQNDANAGALAEWKHGAGRGCKNMVFLTFGTGLGAGLILDGRLYTGANGQAGEIGHIRLSEYGPAGYGKLGSFESFCSGGGISRLGRSMVEAEFQLGRRPAICPSPDGLDALNAKAIGIAAERGDPLARKIYAEAGKKLGAGLSIIIDIFNPEMIIIGSVFARNRNEIWPAALEVIEREALTIPRESCRIVPCMLGDEIGDYSAITTAEYEMKTRRETLHQASVV